MKKKTMAVMTLIIALTLTGCGTSTTVDPTPTPTPTDDPPYVSQVLLDQDINVDNGGDLLTAVQKAITVMDAKDGQIPITAGMLSPQIDTTQAGSYKVTLTAVDSGGNTASFQLNVVVAKAVVETLPKQDYLASLEDTGWLDTDHKAEAGYGLTLVTDEGGFRFTYAPLDSDVAVTGYLENYYPISKTIATFTGTYTLVTDSQDKQVTGDYTITIDIADQKSAGTIKVNYDFGLKDFQYDNDDVTYTQAGQADMMAVSEYWHTHS